MIDLIKPAIIDGDHILWICLNGIKKLDENGQPIRIDNKFVYDPKPFEQACEESDKYISDILTKTRATHYVGFLEGSSKRRLEINPEYKANRKDIKRPDRYKDLVNYIYTKWNFIIINSYKDSIFSGYEVDDIVASARIRIPDSFIISPDKDLLNLEGTHYNPKKDEWMTISEDAAEYYFWKSMIIGDTADGIKGLPGKGEAFMKKLCSDISMEDHIGQYIFGAYLEHYKPNYTLALEEFYKNYNSLKIVDTIEYDFKSLIQNI